jgi:hypothetical protein
MSIEWKTVYYWGKRRLPVMIAFGQGFVVPEIREGADHAEAIYPGVMDVAPEGSYIRLFKMEDGTQMAGFMWGDGQLTPAQGKTTGELMLNAAERVREEGGEIGKESGHGSHDGPATEKR